MLIPFTRLLIRIFFLSGYWEALQLATTVERVYVSLIESMLQFSILVWYGTSIVENRKNWTGLSELIGRRQTSLDKLCHQAVLSKARPIVAECEHLYFEFEMMTSERFYRMHLASKKVYTGSFVPKAISILINKMLWFISIVVLNFYMHMYVCWLIATRIFILTIFH